MQLSILMYNFNTSDLSKYFNYLAMCADFFTNGCDQFSCAGEERLILQLEPMVFKRAIISDDSTL